MDINAVIESMGRNDELRFKLTSPNGELRAEAMPIPHEWEFLVTGLPGSPRVKPFQLAQFIWRCDFVSNMVGP